MYGRGSFTDVFHVISAAWELVCMYTAINSKLVAYAICAFYVHHLLTRSSVRSPQCWLAVVLARRASLRQNIHTNRWKKVTFCIANPVSGKLRLECVSGGGCA